jgi:predicted dehydrogenase
MKSKIRVIVIGCGNMGSSHARAYHKIPGFELVGLVDRSPEKRDALSDELGGIRQFDDVDIALLDTKPDAACICTYPDSHADLAIKCLNANAHVFVEKPLAVTVEKAVETVKLAQDKNRKLMVGYILRVHPSWKKFVEIARTLGKPLVMRMNLNQQSKKSTWQWHLNLMKSMSPIVDCGVHYVDIMCQMTRSAPVRVHAIGARLTEELKPDMYNYGQLQVIFEDGSVGWYEAGWGPMMSEVAFFVKDVIGPKGCISIMDPDHNGEKGSDDIDSHTQTNRLKLHPSEMDENHNYLKPDEVISTEDEPDHQELCDLEQEFFLGTILNDQDLSAHQDDAVNSLKIVLAADESFRTGKVIELK